MTILAENANPCPFCRSKRSIWVVIRHTSRRFCTMDAHAECAMCGAQGPVVRVLNRPDRVPEITAKAIEGWNKAKTN